MNNVIDSNNTSFSSPKFREKITKKYIQPSYEKDYKTHLSWKSRWHKLSTAFYVMSMICFGAQTVISGIIPSLTIPLFVSYVGSGLGVGGLILERFSKFFTAEEKQEVVDLNKLNRSIGINDSIPDISYDVSQTDTNAANMQQSNSAPVNSNADINYTVPVNSPIATPTIITSTIVPVSSSSSLPMPSE